MAPIALLPKPKGIATSSKANFYVFTFLHHSSLVGSRRLEGVGLGKLASVGMILTELGKIGVDQLLLEEMHLGKLDNGVDQRLSS